MSKKHTLIAVTGLVAILLAAPVYAQTTPPASPAPTAPAPAVPATAPPAPQTSAAAPQAQSKPTAEDKAAEAKRFSDYKQQLLTRIDDLVTKMKDRRSCIQASTNRDSMIACFPQRTQAPASPAKADGKSKDLAAPAPAPQSQPPAAPPAVKK
jgi:hypothetical protein